MVPDYYARLGVDPKADRTEIDAALQRKQPAWSMGTRNPKTRHANQLYLDEIPALRRALLSDPATRAAYDAELAVNHRAERDRKFDELQRRVRLRAAKGGLGPSDRGLLIDEAARLGLNEDDLLRITRPIPNLVEAPSVNGDAELDLDPPADVLDPSTRRQIRMALEHLGCRDLYDAIGLTRDAPASDITARADTERQRWMKKAQVTAEKTAWLEVITHAQSHLGSPRLRARYDRTLALETEESFDRLADFALKGLRAARPRHPGGAHRGGRRAGDRHRPRRSPDRPDLPTVGHRARGGIGGTRIAEPRAGFDAPRRGDGGQRSPEVHPAALPQLRGRDRAEPGGAQGRLGAMSALRIIITVELSGLSTCSVG